MSSKHAFTAMQVLHQVVILYQGFD